MPRSPNEIRDELLVLRCQRGDPGAWDDLLACYHRRLFYFARRIVGNDDQAAHLLQDAWPQIFRSMSTLRQGDRLAPWLYTIVRRTIIDERRRRPGHRHVSADDAAELELETDSDPQDAFDNAELVHFGLDRIGEREREVLTLFFLEELSIDEVAQILEIPPGTVKSRLFQARRELREVLARETGLKHRASNQP